MKKKYKKNCKQCAVERQRGKNSGKRRANVTTRESLALTQMLMVCICAECTHS